MPLLVTSVPNLVQGISQQPDNLRYPGQSDEQVNAWSTIVEGLVKRPNTEFVDTIAPADDTDLFTHFVKRDEDNKYVVTVGDNSGPEVKVTNLETGADIPVSTTSIATSYLSGITTPRTDLTALTVADYTFLVNKNKQILRNTDADLKSKDIRNAEGKYEALVFVKLGDYEKAYSIYLDGKLVPLTPSLQGTTGHDYHDYTNTAHLNSRLQPATYISGPSTSGTGAGSFADTEYIARDLKDCLNDYVVGDTTVSGGVLTVGSGSGFIDSGRTVSGAYAIDSEYEYELEQYDIDHTLPGAVQIGFGAKGTVVFKNGQVQSSELTHSGSGYDNALATATPATVKVIIKQTSKYWSYVLAKKNEVTTIDYTTSGYTMPTVSSLSFATSDLTVEREGAVIKITSPVDFSIRTEDGLANQGLGVAYKEVNSIVDLPSRCFNDFRIKVRGDADIDQDDYYVQFETKDKENYGEGSWVEIVGWTSETRAAATLEGIDTTLDSETMPITLVPSLSASGTITKFFLQAQNELEVCFSMSV